MEGRWGGGRVLKTHLILLSPCFILTLFLKYVEIFGKLVIKFA